MIKREEIQIRDPFVLPLEKEKKYYLYGTTDKNCWGDTAEGFDAYTSSDLENWEGPYHVFVPPEGFWADRNFWAPEVYQYEGRYYMFASFKANNVHRGTQVLVSESPTGPFVPHSPRPVTPDNWECLDGTLYIDDEGQPWMVFCHEWKQVYDGEMRAMKLSKDLSAPAGEPVLLFRASEAPWTKCYEVVCMENGTEIKKETYVTDGPFIYRTKDNQLLMLWSSRGNQGYAMGIARSASGKITGPWTHDEEPLYAKDGGHGMIFKTFDGQLMLTIHTPNKTPNERPVFLKIKEENGKLILI